MPPPMIKRRSSPISRMTKLLEVRKRRGMLPSCASFIPSLDQGATGITNFPSNRKLEEQNSLKPLALLMESETLLGLGVGLSLRSLPWESLILRYDAPLFFECACSNIDR